ncbi:uncharacterized protein [Amphiura filiformis]|uniref:uncharacterized protein n=1 Tax=Amphiura filiformis TaxID=82378 RepID=UPI003B21D882
MSERRDKFLKHSSSWSPQVERSGTPRQRIKPKPPPLRTVHYSPSEEYGPALDIPELHLKPNNRLEPLEELMMCDVDYDADGDKEIVSQQKPVRRKRPRHSHQNRARRSGKYKKQPDLDREPTPNWEKFILGDEDFEETIFPRIPSRTGHVVQLRSASLYKDLEDDSSPELPSGSSGLPNSPAISITPDMEELLKEVAKIVPERKFQTVKNTTTCRDVLNIMNYKTTPGLRTKKAYHRQQSQKNSTFECENQPKQKPLVVSPPPSVLRPALQKRSEGFNTRRLHNFKEVQSTITSTKIGSNASSCLPAITPGNVTATNHHTYPPKIGIPAKVEVKDPRKHPFARKPCLALRPPTPATFGAIDDDDDDDDEEDNPFRNFRPFYPRPPAVHKPATMATTARPTVIPENMKELSFPAKSVLPRPRPRPPGSLYHLSAAPLSPDDNKSSDLVPKPHSVPKSPSAAQTIRTRNIRRQRYTQTGTHVQKKSQI